MAEVDDFPLLPTEDGTSADEDLAAAADSALDEGFASAAGDAPVPFGRTPLFDFEAGRYVRRGGSPVFVTGHAALAQWVMTALYSARYAHRVFTDEFGMEEPDSPLGQAVHLQEELSDWGERLREAVVVHDRVVSVENFDASYDSSTGVITINTLDIVTDEDDTISMGPLSVDPVRMGDA